VPAPPGAATEKPSPPSRPVTTNASHIKPKVKLDKLVDKANSAPKFTVPFAQLQSTSYVIIEFEPGSKISARINSVSLPEITTLSGTKIPGGTVTHGHEIKQLDENDSEVLEIGPGDVVVESENELRVTMLDGVNVDIGVVTKTKLQ
jgi:hypothetical protein